MYSQSDGAGSYKGRVPTARRQAAEIIRLKSEAFVQALRKSPADWGSVGPRLSGAGHANRQQSVESGCRQYRWPSAATTSAVIGYASVLRMTSDSVDRFYN